METKELILKNALDMFAKSGYDSVSIRDIACKVDIKESSIYYHFKNKQDILDSLVVRYEDYIKELTGMLEISMSGLGRQDTISWDWLKMYYFEKYLFDPFCNQMLRLLMIEQFHNDNIRILYQNYLFDLPKKIQTESFRMLSQLGILSEKLAGQIANGFFANISVLTFKYLLSGELTQEKKDLFCKEAFACMNELF